MARDVRPQRRTPLITYGITFAIFAVTAQGQADSTTVTDTLSSTDSSSTTSATNLLPTHLPTRTLFGNATATTKSTTASPTQSQPPASRVQCIQLNSQFCPSYNGYMFDANSLVIVQHSAGDSGISGFDKMIDYFATGGPNTDLINKSGCGTWQPEQTRYGHQFYCDFFLSDPYVIGATDQSSFDAAQSSPNCNTNNPANPLPRIANDTCTGFANSVQIYLNSANCSSSTPDSRANVMDYINNECANALYYGQQLNAPFVDMTKDVSAESKLCGFGIFQNDVASQQIKAYDYCKSDPTDSCCSSDPNLALAIKEGGFAVAGPMDAWTCMLHVSSSFKPSCGQVLGTMTGFVFGVASVLIVWWGSQRQDKEAMARTVSGKFQQEHAWMVPANWWTLASGKTATSSTVTPSYEKNEDYQNHQQQRTRKRRPSGTTATHHPQQQQQQQQFQHRPRSDSKSPIRTGVDPLAEMMGGGGGGGSVAIPSYKAKFDYQGSKGTPEMDSVRTGDRLVVLEVKSGGVALARNLETGRQGLVPANILAR